MSGETPHEFTYSARGAWIRASTYFAVCLFVSAYVGVSQRLFSEPLVSAGQLTDPTWLVLTLVVSAHVVFGYFYFWPKGTVSHGRPRQLLAGIVFGFLWGFCQGQLMLVVYEVIAGFGLAITVNIALMIVAWSVWAALWQSRYWDIRIAPEHNIEAWNLRKILIVHLPFLLLCITHYALFGNTALFLVWQIAALMASTLIMRFPAP